MPVGFENHFRVGEAIQINSLAFKLCANLAKVVNLAVVYDPIAAGRIVHGLMPARRQIENCEAAISQPNFDCMRLQAAQNDGAAVVWSAMSQGSSGPLENLGRNW